MVVASRSFTIGCLAAIGLLGSAGQDATAEGAKGAFVEQQLGVVPTGARRFAFSQDGRHVAIASEDGGKGYIISVDGKPGPEHSAIDSPALSPDGTRLAYVTWKGEKWIVVVDGKPSPEYDEIINGRDVFASYDERFRHGWEPEPPFWSRVIFSSDGKRFAYGAVQGQKSLVVVDGLPGTTYDEIGFLLFSPDGKRFAYTARIGQKQFVVVDGRPEREYDRIASLWAVFSQDGKRVAYVARSSEQLSRRGDIVFVAEAGKEFIVVDGQPGPKYEMVQMPVFSSDGKRLAYIATEGEEYFVVVDGQRGPRYEAVGPPVFSPNGERVAYPAKKGQKWLVVVDDKQQSEYDEIVEGTVKFSPNGRRVAYVAIEGEKILVNVDGQPGPSYDNFGPSPLIFSPDSKRFAYAALNGSKTLIVVDGQPISTYESSPKGTLIFRPKSRPPDPAYSVKGSLIFSPDSRHLAYRVADGQGEFVVVDGERGARFDWIDEKGPSFLSDGTLVFIAFRNCDIFRVEKSHE
jgi:Tol biopolymer transport system component